MRRRRPLASALCFGLLALAGCVRDQPAATPAGTPERELDVGPAEREGPVRIELTDVAHETVKARLLNTTNRPVSFYGYLHSPGAEEAIWTPLHATDVLVDGDWAELPRGWCATDTGPIRVPPGASVRLSLAGLDRTRISRARVGWRADDGSLAGVALSDEVPPIGR